MFGKVTLSHALALGSLEEAAIRDIAQKFIETGIDLTSTVPIGMPTMPIQPWLNKVLRSPWLMTV